MNMQPQACAEERKLQLQELEEIRLEAYDATMWYKEKTKLWHDKNLRVKKLPYTIVALRANGAVELQGSDPDSASFMVNGHRVKPFRDNSEAYTVEEIPLCIPEVFT
ncbi:uncharacterized protein LOC121808956 [Salvia splendens]|uniref:uncharacterized protein LOC121808956 n=1 Tax=Salvia splendens TaxID=180675 RepID=UPI001C2674C6|nr:uncharacterized protein LOC121808956 [Salvia splendens]